MAEEKKDDKKIDPLSKDTAIGGTASTDARNAPDQGADAQSIHGKIEEILKEYDGQESRIPLTHDYWAMLNQYRVENSKEQGK
jgi:hypothetical protein